MEHRKSQQSSNGFEAKSFVVSPRNVFLHFVDHEFLSLTCLDKAPSSWLFRHMRRAMSAALLVAKDHVYLPAAAYFESEYARHLFNLFPQFRQFGILRLVGSAFSVGDFVEAKRPQYANDRDRYPRYFNDREVRRLLGVETNWLCRSASATHDIACGWNQSIKQQEEMWDVFAHRHHLLSVARLEDNLLAVPERLGHAAFIADFVLPLLPVSNTSYQDRNEINAFITKQYIHSYLREFAASCLIDLPFADSRPVLGKGSGYISYQKLLHLWRGYGIDTFLLHASDSELLHLRFTEAWSVFLQRYCWLASLQDDDKDREVGKPRRHLSTRFLNPVDDLEGVIRRIETIVNSSENRDSAERLSELERTIHQHIPISSMLPQAEPIDDGVVEKDAQIHPLSEECRVLPTPLFSERKIKIFFAYAQTDEALCKRLERHLSEIGRRHHLIWYDHHLSPGQERAKEIERHFNTAHIIGLLVSADFLASDSSYQLQMHRALARHEAGEAWVIPIVLRPSDWQRTPLGKLVALPLNGKAVTSWKNMDEAFQDIAIGVSQSVEHIQQSLQK